MLSCTLNIYQYCKLMSLRVSVCVDVVERGVSVHVAHAPHTEGDDVNEPEADDICC